MSATLGDGRDHETLTVRRVVLAAFLLNLALTVVKALLAVHSNSVAITASVIDSGADVVASLAVLVGVRLSTRRSSSFPLGMHKVENVISVVVAIFIFVAAYEIARTVVLGGGAKAPSVSLLSVLTMAGATLIVFLFGRYARAQGKRTESPALIAEAKHRGVDALSSLTVLVSTVLSYLGVGVSIGNISIDRIAAGVVLIFVLRAGWELLSDGMRVLLDASLDKDTLAVARRVAEDQPEVEEILNLVGRSAGRYRFIQMTVTLRVAEFSAAHAVSERIESGIRRALGHVERVVVHYEPRRNEQRIVAVPVGEDGQTISTHFGESEQFLLITVTKSGGEVGATSTLPNPHRHAVRAKGIRVAQWLREQAVDEVILSSPLDKEGPLYALRSGGIEVRVVGARTADELVPLLAGLHSGATSDGAGE